MFERTEKSLLVLSLDQICNKNIKIWRHFCFEIKKLHSFDTGNLKLNFNQALSFSRNYCKIWRNVNVFGIWEHNANDKINIIGVVFPMPKNIDNNLLLFDLIFLLKY